jgi:hypothetical protein
MCVQQYSKNTAIFCCIRPVLLYLVHTHVVSAAVLIQQSECCMIQQLQQYSSYSRGSGYADLPAAWRCIEPYLATSGGAVNWGKTQGLRCGPLRRPGHAGGTCYWPVPQGAEHMKGIQYVDVDSDEATRHLGVYLRRSSAAGVARTCSLEDHAEAGAPPHRWHTRHMVLRHADRAAARHGHMPVAIAAHESTRRE